MMTSLGEPPKKLQVVDLNPHLTCILCGGYFIDATTITECLHSFCRACIVRYLETSKYCPVCEVQIHKTRPLRCIRSDQMLQDIVYKLVPGLFQNEMKMRRELYASQPPEALKFSKDPEDRGETTENRVIYGPDELFDLVIQFAESKSEERANEAEGEPPDKDWLRRFLRCPAALKAFHLKKFIRYKYNIPNKFMILLENKDELLRDEYSLMDVAYISSWKRNGSLHLSFRVLERPQVQIPAETETAVETICYPETDVAVTTESQVPSADTELHGEVQTTNEDDVKINSLSSTKSKPEESTSEPAITETTAESQKTVEDRSDSTNSKVVSVSDNNKNCDISLLKDGASVPVATSERNCSPKETSTPVSEETFIPLKVPKLTIPLTPKILEQAAQHAIEDKLESDSDLFDEGRLVIAEPEVSSKEDDEDRESSPKVKTLAEDDEVDSGRGSDTSIRTEARSVNGDDEVSSPGSSVVYSPILEKVHPFPMSSPISCPKIPPSIGGPLASSSKDDSGPLDLSVCHRKRSCDRVFLPRSKPVANPPILDKHRQVSPCLVIPKHPSFKLLPAVLPHSSLYKKPADCSRGYFRYNRGSTLTAFNPDPNSDRPKIVIKNLDPKPAHRHHHHHHKM